MASIPTNPPPKTTTFFTFCAISLILSASSKSLNPITLFASLKFSIGGINEYAPVANNIFSYLISSPSSKVILCPSGLIPITSFPLIHFILYLSKNSLGVKSKSSTVLRPSK